VTDFQPSGRTLTVLVDAAGAPRALRIRAYLLKVIRGPDLRRQMRVAQQRVRVGSGEGADFRLADPSVSAAHCELVSEERGLRIVDLGAKNGVVVGGRRMDSGWLEDRDELRLGNTVLRLHLLDEAEETALDAGASFGRLRGGSVPMRQLYAQLAKAAAAEVTVLLRGETGTGKELAAEAIALSGPRRDQPFEVVDCASLSSSLAESQLFGHEQYAFTGANRRHLGAFERARGGTVFLDEVGELPLELQPKLLGVLERGTVQRVGGDRAIRVDARVIAATHRELDREVNRGAFRADLFYRLAVAEIRLPPLRERREDIPELIASFLEEIPGASALSPEVLRRLGDADYPGNVRGLKNAVERAALGLGVEIHPAPPEAVDLDTPYRVQRDRLLAGFDHAYLSKLLLACGGNVSEAARRAGLSRVRLYEMLRTTGLDRGRDRRW
jgi:DNA-binding NtrC family response regulator